MDDVGCPICEKTQPPSSADGFERFSCELCRQVCVAELLARRPYGVGRRNQVLGGVRELAEGHGQAFLSEDETIYAKDRDGNRIGVSFPETIPARAHKLLAAMIRRSKFFGHDVELSADTDYPLAYAQNADEFREYARYLEQLELIETYGSPTVDGHLPEYRVTAAGYESHSKISHPALCVFLSSTCHDLKDCRAELAQHLEQRGHVVLASDDPYRFEVSPTENSIQTCLRNVEQSDVVLCIIDQRYGGILPDGPFAGLSATHAEVRHARALGKPVHFFIRQEAYSDWTRLKRDPSSGTNWVEQRSDPAKRLQWRDFVSECIELPATGGFSNWFDLFSSVIDLKPLAEKRLADIRNRI